ncbi:uncharacterized protein LOC112686830 [Sipha flava]|uniref:Uncharacterized protein LOC112686830 n=1 Tax=Sipha flava TaxID=143950 RepID=A0A8B8FXJ1_9HEMI|nr:uncharacterized protein LOC112686830 [Sipha flava]
MVELDLIFKYKNNADFSISVKMVLALAFVKIDDLDTAIKALNEHVFPELLPLLDWFEEYYVGRTIRNRRRPARFPPALWNVHERILNKEDRTNNHAEASNRRLNLQMGVQHPTLWTFISNLRKVQSGRDIFYQQLEAGNSLSKKKKKFIDVDKRIFKIVKDYNNRNIIVF